MRTTYRLGWTLIVAAACVAGAGAAEPLAVSKDACAIKICRGQQPLLEYRFASVPFKPYASQMWTPAGVQVLRDSPFDHKHHHGLMFALEADGVDFWGETPKNGKQILTKLIDPTVYKGGELLSKKIQGTASATNQYMLVKSHGSAMFHEHLDWKAPDGTVILREIRTVAVHDAPEVAATVLSWSSMLDPGPGREKAKLTGHHYFGLGARFLEGMDKIGEFTNASGQPGETVRGDEKLVAAKWCAYTAPVDGKPVTVAIFDSLRHPPRMFTMSKPFAYMSATLNLWKEPLELKSGQQFELLYGVAVCDGKLDATAIEKLYNCWRDLLFY